MQHIRVVVEQLRLFDGLAVLLMHLYQIIAYFYDLVAIVDVAFDEVVQVGFEATNDLALVHLQRVEYALLLEVVQCHKFISSILRILDTRQHNKTLARIVDAEVEDFRSIIFVMVDVNGAGTSKHRLQLLYVRHLETFARDRIFLGLRD